MTSVAPTSPDDVATESTGHADEIAELLRFFLTPLGTLRALDPGGDRSDVVETTDRATVLLRRYARVYGVEQLRSVVTGSQDAFGVRRTVRWVLRTTAGRWLATVALHWTPTDTSVECVTEADGRQV